MSRYRRLQWLSIVVAVLSLAALVFTCRFHLGGKIDRFGYAGMYGSVMFIVRSSPVQVPWCWFEQQSWSWPNWLPAMYGNFTALLIPLWIPTLAAAIAALVFHRKARLAHLGCCPSCDYDLTGNESGVCPECGTAKSFRSPKCAASRK